MDAPGKTRRQRPFGAWSLALAVVTMAGVAIIGVTSTTSFTPGNAFLIVSSLVMIVGWVTSVVLGVAALKGRDRRWAMAGLALAVLSLAAFVVLVNVVA